MGVHLPLTAQGRPCQCKRRRHGGEREGFGNVSGFAFMVHPTPGALVDTPRSVGWLCSGVALCCRPCQAGPGAPRSLSDIGPLKQVLESPTPPKKTSKKAIMYTERLLELDQVRRVRAPDPTGAWAEREGASVHASTPCWCLGDDAPRSPFLLAIGASRFLILVRVWMVPLAAALPPSCHFWPTFLL